MKIVFKNNELIFRKVPDIFINGENRKSDDWSSTILFNDYELDFEFDESIFKYKETEEIDIDWIIVEELVEHILENIEAIQTKGSLVLEELYSQVFGEEHLNKCKGYFKMGGIKLQKYKKIEKNPFSKSYFEYEIHYFLESGIDYLMDPYHSYKAKFSSHNGLTIIGVTRIG